jgi:hypothetical protein
MAKFAVLFRSPFYKNLDNLALLFCFMNLVFCVIISGFREVGTFDVETDFYGVYAIETQNILAGRPYTYQHNPPGYCLLLAAITYLTKDIFFAGKLISALTSSIFAYVNYVVIKYLFEEKIALIITIITLCAVIPYSLVASTDVLGATLIVASIWLYLRPKKYWFSEYLGVGCLAGIGYLIRSNIIFVGMAIVISLIIINPHQVTIKKRCGGIIVFLSGLLLVITPWLLYNWELNGSPFHSSAYAQIAAHFYHPQGDSFITAVNEMMSQFNSFSEVIFYDPIIVFTKYFQDVLFLNISSLLVSKFLLYQLIELGWSWWQILIFVAPALTVFSTGLFLVIREPNIRKTRVAWLLINLLGYLILGLVGFSRRYYLFLLPVIFLFVIYPFFYTSLIRDFLAKRIPRFPIAKFFILSLIVSVFLSGGLECYYLLHNEPKYLLKIADFLKHKYPAAEVIIVRKPHLAYLSQLKYSFPLATTPEEYLREAKSVNAKLIVYSDYEAKLWPGLQNLANPDLLPKNFHLVYAHSSSNTLIYEIK